MDIRNYFNPVTNKKNSTKRKKDNEQSKNEDDSTSKRVKTIDPSTYFSNINKKDGKSKKKTTVDTEDNTSKEISTSKKSKVKPTTTKNNDDIIDLTDNNRQKKVINKSKQENTKVEKAEKPVSETVVKRRANTRSKTENQEIEHKTKLTKATDESKNEQVEEEKPKKKFNYRDYLAKKNAGPKAPGSKVIPKGKENCLLGMTFVFTGDLSSLSREDATDLVKRYGGRVTSAPSSKTTYLVVGEDPGESKLAKAKKHNITQIDEDELLDLIGSSMKDNGKTEDDDIKDDPIEIDEPVKKTTKVKTENPPKSLASMINRKSGVRAAKNTVDIEKIDKMDIDEKSRTNDALLWVDKYKPKDVSEIIGHKTNLDRIRSWLRDWKSGAIFKKDSPKALLLSGPPGIGKTTSAILCSEAEGFKPIEFNASDARSKNILKNTLSDLIGNHTMTEYFDKNSKSKKKAN